MAGGTKRIQSLRKETKNIQKNASPTGKAVVQETRNIKSNDDEDKVKKNGNAIRNALLNYKSK